MDIKRKEIKQELEMYLKKVFPYEDDFTHFYTKINLDYCMSLVDKHFYENEKIKNMTDKEVDEMAKYIMLLQG